MQRLFARARSMWPTDPVEVGHWRGLLVGAAVGAFACWAALTYTGWIEASDKADWWDMAGALATTAAAAVALSLGVIPLRQQVRLQRNRRKIISWLAIPKLYDVESGCELVIDVIDANSGASSHMDPKELEVKLDLALGWLDVQTMLDYSDSFHLFGENGPELARIVFHAQRLKFRFEQLTRILPSRLNGEYPESVRKAAVDLKRDIEIFSKLADWHSEH